MAKHVKETLGQFQDFQYFSLLESKKGEKNEENEEKMKQEDAKEGLEVVTKLQDNLDRFKAAAGDKIIDYKEFWEENKRAKESFDEAGEIYKMFDSDYVAGVLTLPDEAVSEEEIDAQIEEVDKKDGGEEEDHDEETETPEEEAEESEEEEEKEEGKEKPLVKESLNEGDDLNLDFNEPSDDDPKLGEEPELEAPEEEMDAEPELEEPGTEGEEPELDGETDLEGEPEEEMEFDEEGEEKEFFVVYNMGGEEREEVFRTDDPGVIEKFRDFYENSFKGSMKEQILKYKQEQEEKRKEAEIKAKEKAREERRGKLDKFMQA